MGLNMKYLFTLEMSTEKTPIIEVKHNTYYELNEPYVQPKQSNILVRFLRKIYEFIVKPPSHT
jgi:hypothetical protein